MAEIDKPVITCTSVGMITLHKGMLNKQWQYMWVT